MKPEPISQTGIVLSWNEVNDVIVFALFEKRREAETPFDFPSK